MHSPHPMFLSEVSFQILSSIPYSRISPNELGFNDTSSWPLIWRSRSSVLSRDFSMPSMFLTNRSPDPVHFSGVLAQIDVDIERIQGEGCAISFGVFPAGYDGPAEAQRLLLRQITDVGVYMRKHDLFQV
jgi:hypothetical protein